MDSNQYRRVYLSTLVVCVSLIFLSRVFIVGKFLEHAVFLGIAVWMLILLYVVYRKSLINFDESDADYYYYYGFILTLVTLSATFVPFAFSSDSVTRESVLGGFGLGLTTTFVGLVGRILLYQQFERLSSGTETAVQTIGIVSNRFARELSELTSSMASSLEQLSKSYEESATSLKSATAVLSSEVATVAQGIRGLNAEVANTRTSLASTTSELAHTLTDSGTASREALSAMAESGRGASESLARLDQVAKLAQLEQLTKNSEAAAGALGNLTSHAALASDALRIGSADIKQGLSIVATSAESAGKKCVDVTESLTGSLSALGSLESTYASLNNSLDTSGLAIGNAAEAIAGVVGSIKEGFDGAIGSLTKLTAITEPLSVELAKFQTKVLQGNESLGVHHSQLVALTDKLTLAGSSLSGMAVGLTRSESQLKNLFEGEIKELGGSVQELSEKFGTARTVIQVLNSEISIASEQISTLRNEQTALWNAQKDIQKLVSDTHEALLGSLRSIRDELK